MKKIMAIAATLAVAMGIGMSTVNAEVNVWEGEDGNITLVAEKNDYRVNVWRKDDAFIYAVYETEDGYTYECGTYTDSIYSIVLDGDVWYMPSF